MFLFSVFSSLHSCEGFLVRLNIPFEVAIKSIFKLLQSSFSPDSLFKHALKGNVLTSRLTSEITGNRQFYPWPSCPIKKIKLLKANFRCTHLICCKGYVKFGPESDSGRWGNGKRDRNRLLIFIFDVAACSYGSRVFEKHQLSLSSRVRKKKSLSAGSYGVLIAWTLSTRTDAKMHVGHLRHVCSRSLSAARRLGAILETKSHQSGLGLSNETVLLQRRLADMNDEQPSVSLARFVSHVINEVIQRIQIYSGNLLCVVYDGIIGMNHCRDVLPALEQHGHRCCACQQTMYLPSRLPEGWNKDEKCSTYRKTNDKSVRKRVSVNANFKKSSVLLQWEQLWNRTCSLPFKITVAPTTVSTKFFPLSLAVIK